jgi:hypothetical protein
MRRTELVKEAVSLIKEAHGNIKCGIELFGSAGWCELGSGVHKVAFRKGNIIAKVGFTFADREAIKNLKQARLMKYYAKVYYLSSIGMVQRAVKPVTNKCNQHALMFRKNILREVYCLVSTADRLGYMLSDLHLYNIGTLGGALKVFDCFCYTIKSDEGKYSCTCIECGLSFNCSNPVAQICSRCVRHLDRSKGVL